MRKVAAREARRRLESLLDDVVATRHPVEIVGRRSSAVLVGVAEWSAVWETLDLSTAPGMAAAIREGMRTPVEGCSEDPGW